MIKSVTNHVVISGRTLDLEDKKVQNVGVAQGPPLSISEAQPESSRTSLHRNSPGGGGGGGLTFCKPLETLAHLTWDDGGEEVVSAPGMQLVA